MEPITIVKAVQTCIAAPCQWDAWDSDGNYWYLRFRGCRGTMSKDYDVDRAVREFYDDSVDERIGDITIEDMCLSLGVRYDPSYFTVRGIIFMKTYPNWHPATNPRKIEIDAPRPGQVMLVVANGKKWNSVSVDRSHFNLGNFEILDQALREMDEYLE